MYEWVCECLCVHPPSPKKYTYSIECEAAPQPEQEPKKRTETAQTTALGFEPSRPRPLAPEIRPITQPSYQHASIIIYHCPWLHT